jgi:hypothetical protein
MGIIGYIWNNAVDFRTKVLRPKHFMVRDWPLIDPK